MAAAREKNEKTKNPNTLQKIQHKESSVVGSAIQDLHTVCGKPLGRGHAVPNSPRPSPNYDPSAQRFLATAA